MDPIDHIAAWFAGRLPSYPGGAVSRTASDLGDTVLWSGPAAVPGTVEGMTRAAAWGSLGIAAALAIAVLMGCLLWRGYRGRGEAPTVNQLGSALIAALLLVAMGTVLIVTSMIDAAGWAARGYVVTPTRIVRLQGDQRTDFPATAIASVSRDAVGLSVRTADGQTLKVQTGPADRAALEGAIDRVVEETGKGSRVLRERHG